MGTALCEIGFLHPLEWRFIDQTGGRWNRGNAHGALIGLQKSEVFLEVGEIHNEDDVALKEHSKNVHPDLLDGRRPDFWNSGRVGEFVEVGGKADHDVVPFVVRRVRSVRFYAEIVPIFGTCGAIEIGQSPFQRVGFAFEDPQAAQNADDVVEPAFHAYSMRTAVNPGFSRVLLGSWSTLRGVWSGALG